MNPPVQNNSSLIALASIEDQEHTVESPVFAHPDNPDISVCSNGNPLHTGSINSPTHLHLSQTHLGTQTEPFAYSVGQSPASTTQGSTKLAKAHLIEAAKKYWRFRVFFKKIVTKRSPSRFDKPHWRRNEATSNHYRTITERTSGEWQTTHRYRRRLYIN